MPKRSRLIELMIGALSVVVGWNLDPVARLNEVADVLGMADPSIARAVFSGLGVPVIIIVLTWLSTFVYEYTVWPYWPGTNYVGGLWNYTLIARTDQGDLQVAGWFRVEQNPRDARIIEARAYYVDDDGLVFRGSWTSTAVWVGSRELAFVFNMVAQGVAREPMPSRYSGFLQLAAQTGGPHNERDLWNGYFHDLDDRRGVHGPVAAIRVRGWRWRRDPHAALEDNLALLMRNVAETAGTKIAKRERPSRWLSRRRTVS